MNEYLSQAGSKQHHVGPVHRSPDPNFTISPWGQYYHHHFYTWKTYSEKLNNFPRITADKDWRRDLSSDLYESGVVLSTAPWLSTHHGWDGCGKSINNAYAILRWHRRYRKAGKQGSNTDPPITVPQTHYSTLEASVSSSENWGNNSTYATGLL